MKSNLSNFSFMVCDVSINSETSVSSQILNIFSYVFLKNLVLHFVFKSVIHLELICVLDVRLKFIFCKSVFSYCKLFLLKRLSFIELHFHLFQNVVRNICVDLFLSLYFVPSVCLSLTQHDSFNCYEFPNCFSNSCFLAFLYKFYSNFVYI